MNVTSIPLTINVDNEESFLLAACCNGVSYTTIKPLHSSQCCRVGGREGGKKRAVGRRGWRKKARGTDRMGKEKRERKDEK